MGLWRAPREGYSHAKVKLPSPLVLVRCGPVDRPGSLGGGLVAGETMANGGVLELELAAMIAQAWVPHWPLGPCASGQCAHTARGACDAASPTKSWRAVHVLWEVAAEGAGTRGGWLEWEVPVGRLEHRSTVAHLTLAVTVAGTLAALYSTLALGTAA